MVPLISGGAEVCVVAGVLDLRSEGRWFEDWSLPQCCFLKQEALLHIVSLHPGVINGYWQHSAGGINPAMD